jgi:hypothetical protein
MWPEGIFWLILALMGARMFLGTSQILKDMSENKPSAGIVVVTYIIVIIVDYLGALSVYYGLTNFVEQAF